MDDTADLEAGLRAFLLAAPFAALVEDRIFAGELPAEEAPFMPRAAFLVRASGGVSLTGESELDHDTQRFDGFAFGRTPREAAIVMRSASRTLRGLQRGVYDNVLIHYVNSAGGSSSGREPQTEWPRHFQSFQALHGLTQVSA